MARKIAITGASGHVGRMIVPRLAERGIELVLAGRDPGTLAALFPDNVVAGYDNLDALLPGCDAVVNLAVLNNDQTASLEEFREVNVRLAVRVAAMTQAAGVPLFVNATTVRALDGKASDSYTQSKREAETALRTSELPNVILLRLPAVYGERFAGRLGFLNRFPDWLRRPAISLLAAFRPVVNAGRVADAIEALLVSPPEPEVIVADRQDDNPVYRLCRGAIDAAFVLAVAVFFWWLLALVWLAVRLSSPGPGLFAQPRVGRNEKIFTCYKFRTMQTGAPQAGTHEVPASHVTPLGRLLRASRIDELPQIFNIARGEMSLVGPRPCLPSQLELVGWRRRLGVFSCRPGITGYSQVNGVDMSEPERLARLDGRYCALRTIPLDLRIVVSTIRR